MSGVRCFATTTHPSHKVARERDERRRKVVRVANGRVKCLEGDVTTVTRQDPCGAVSGAPRAVTSELAIPWLAERQMSILLDQGTRQAISPNALSAGQQLRLSVGFGGSNEGHRPPWPGNPAKTTPPRLRRNVRKFPRCKNVSQVMIKTTPNWCMMISWSANQTRAKALVRNMMRVEERDKMDLRDGPTLLLKSRMQWERG